MGLKRNPITYLVLSNVVLWGLPLAINQAQGWLFTHAHNPGEAINSPAGAPLEGLMAGARPAADALLAGRMPGAQGENASLAGLMPIQTEGTGTADSRLDSAAPWTPSPALADLGPSSLDVPLDLRTQLSGADGLGGPITLRSGQEPMVPIAARAEQLQWKRSSDALAALPLHWREPLRRELGDRVRVSQAGTVRLPVRQLAERQEVPVIISDKGLAEGLVQPKDPRTREAVESWAAKQRPSQAGTVQVVVIAAEPLETGRVSGEDSNPMVAALPSRGERLVAAPPLPLPPLPGSSTP